MQSAGTSPLEQPPLRRRRSRPVWERAPWWLLVVSITMAAVVLSMLQTERYARTFAYLLRGVGLTLWISIVSYAIALVIGLLAGLGRVARNRLLNTLSSIYVEVVRGIPLLVIIIAAQFIVAPALNTNRMPVLSGIMALAVGYGAYLAEIYRAGIQSLERGQMDAARSLGMSYRQSMRYVILPQAIRRVLPALGNDFVALLKDSSLVSAIGVAELTKLGQIEGARTFDYIRTFSAVAVLYLILTLLLSLGVQALEHVSRRSAR